MAIAEERRGDRDRTCYESENAELGRFLCRVPEFAKEKVEKGIVLEQWKPFHEKEEHDQGQDDDGCEGHCGEPRMNQDFLGSAMYHSFLLIMFSKRG